MADVELLERRSPSKPAEGTNPLGYVCQILANLIELGLQALGVVGVFCLVLLRATGIGALITRTSFLFRRLESNGIGPTIKKLDKLIDRKMTQGLTHNLKLLWSRLSVLCLKMTRIPWLVRTYYQWQGYKLVPICACRIGHAAAELDGFVKESILTNRPMEKALVLAPRNLHGVNLDVIRLFSRYVRIVESPFFCKVLANWTDPMDIRFSSTRVGGFEEFDVREYVSTTACAIYPKILAEWGDRPPVVEFSRQDRDKGSQLTRALGLPEGAWFVCLHCREGGFHRHEGTESNCRDSNIDNYLLAAATIVSRGGWCIRMGDPSMKRLPAMPGVVDYAHHPLRSSWSDVYLMGSCRFFLGSASGLGCVANVFGIPSAIANQLPLSVVYNHAVRDISIPKLYRSNKNGKIISFEDILATPLADYRKQEEWDQDDLTPIENTPDEINELAIEMLDALDGKLVYAHEDEELQNQVRSFFNPKHYSYHARGRIGRAFLRKHRQHIA